MISLAFAIVVTTICEIDGTILTRIFTNNQDVIKNGAFASTWYPFSIFLTLLFSKIPNVTLFHMGITAPLSTMISLIMIFIYFKKTKFDNIKER